MLIIQFVLFQILFSKNAGKYFILIFIAQTIEGKSYGVYSSCHNLFLNYQRIDLVQTTTPNLTLNDNDLIFNLPINSSIKYNQIFKKTSHIDHTPIINKSEVNEILLQFDKIQNDLNGLFVMQKSDNSDLKRKVRSPFSKRTVCNVSKDKLTNLQNAINNHILNSNTLPYSSSNCEYSSTSDDCNELIKLIQCGVNKLKDKFIESTTNQVSYTKFLSLKNAYEDMIRKYNSVQDDLTKSVTQKYQREIDALKVNIQTLSNSLNKAINRLQIQTVDLCISEINSGKIDSAVSRYKELSDDSLLPTIIEKSYNYLGDFEIYNFNKRIENFDNLVEFIRKLQYVYELAIGFTKLYETMRINDHLSSPKMLIFAEMVQEVLDFSNFNEIPEKYQNSLKSTSANTCACKIVSNWATKILNNDYEVILTFAKNKMTRYQSSFRLYLPSIINYAYSADVNIFNKILTFIDNLPYIEQMCVGLSALYENMKTNNDFCCNKLRAVSLKVEKVMNFPNYNIIKQEFKNQLESTKNSLGIFFK